MSEVSFRPDRLNALMKKRKLNAGQLAYMTGISRTMIFYLQKGERTNVSAGNLAKIADALSTSTQYLIGETDDDSPIQKTMSALVADIAGMAEQLSPARQRQLRALGEALIQADQSTDVDAIYSELMDLITRLAELEGGKKALDELIEHIGSVSASGRSTSSTMPRRAGRRRAPVDAEPTEQPAESDE